MTTPVTSADAVVIGAGVIGAAIALELQRAGRSVLVLDKAGAVGAGSTSSSAAVVRFTYSTFEGVAASWEAMHLWRDWANHIGDIEAPLARYHRVGMLMLLPPEFPSATIVDAYDRLGIPNEILSSVEIAERFPAIDTGRFHPPRSPDDPRFFDDASGSVVGWWTPDAGFVDDPQLATDNLMRAAVAAGARLRLRAEVVGVDVAGERLVGVRLADGSTIASRIVVNAAGPWSGHLNRIAGVDRDFAMATRTLRQEVHVVPTPAGFGVDGGGTAVGDFDLGTYFRPHPGGTILVGGIEAECDPLVWDEDPDTADPSPSAALWEAQVHRLARRLPDLTVPHRPIGVASHYDVSPDWVPTYDRTGLDGFYVAVGTSGNQFKNAPVVGQMMADLIEACEGGHDHDRSPVQFRCRRTGTVIDLGHYARNRLPAATSGTVSG
ncbi:MAG: oxidoreductase [Ilumatobacteraceae bacterium]|nr:oxidoreductase [Ilumatobacteraceae bacterium]